MGIEVHVELNTKTKMFCGCATTFGNTPNSQVCPICLAMPGALPAVNEKAVESAIRLGLALECQVASFSRFARKNYFYPDVPKNRSEERRVGKEWRDRGAQDDHRRE